MESNHRQVAYETTALPLSYRDVILVPVVGFELTTYRLQGGCSTTELIRHKMGYEKLETSTVWVAVVSITTYWLQHK